MSIKKEFSTIKFEIKEKVGVLTINRPTKMNALNADVLSELKELLDTFKTSSKLEMAGLIVTGEGEKAFIAGADIGEMSDMTASEAYTFGTLGQQVSLGFENLTVPVIACVNGFALGGGCEMALSCDFIYATENAVFGQPEVKLGLIPGFGGTQRLAKIIGRNHAKELIYTGRNMKIDEAVKLNLVVKKFATKDEMISDAIKTIGLIAQNSPLAVAASKKVMNEGIDLTITEGLQLEKRQFSGVFTSEDMREGTRAFLDKRAPQFKGI